MADPYDGVEHKGDERPTRMRRYTSTAMPNVWTGAHSVRAEAGRDPRREWELGQLTKSLEDMTAAVTSADERLRVPGPPVEEVDDEDDGDEGAEGYGTGGIIRINFDELPICEGWLWIKGGGRGRAWRQRYFRLEGTELRYYQDDEDDRVRATIPIDANTTVAKGSLKEKHKHKVKFDFLVSRYVQELDDTFFTELYADTQEVAVAWMQTVETVIAACRRALLPPAPKRKVTPDDPETLARAADEAKKHTAHGQGLYEAVRGESTSFTVQKNDAFGNPDTMGGEGFKVVIESDDLHFDLDILDHNDGQYTVEYTPPRAGEYELTVTFNGFHIYGSPFHPTVQPAPTAASHCLIAGDGATVARTSQTNTFTIVARDQFDGPRGVGGDRWEVSVEGPALIKPVEDHGNGCYTFAYDVDLDSIMTRSGGGGALRHQEQRGISIYVSLNNPGFKIPRPVNGTPFQPSIMFDAPIAASPPQAPATPTMSLFSPVVSRGVGATPHSAHSSARGSGSAHGSALGVRDTPEATSSGVGPMSMVPATPAPAPAPAPAPGGVDAALTDRLTTLLESLSAKEASMDAKIQQLDTMHSHWEQQMAHMQELARLLTAQMKFLASTGAFQPGATPAPTAATPGGVQAASAALSGAGPSPTEGPSFVAAASPPRAPPVTPAETKASEADLKLSPAPAPRGSVSFSEGAPSELFEPEVVTMFDNHQGVLHKVYTYYADGAELTVDKLKQLGRDYNLVPTFLTKRELRAVYTETLKINGGDSLSYLAFVEALGRLTLVALSKPAFASVYPTTLQKIEVLFDLWGLGENSRLERIKRGH